MPNEAWRGKKLDYWAAMEVGVPVDVGWGVAVLNADHTVTRTCKGCGVSVTSPIIPDTNDVEPKPIVHLDDCSAFARL